MTTPTQPSAEALRAEIKFFILERGHSQTENTLHSFDTEKERDAKTQELIYGESSELCPDDARGLALYLEELRDSGRVEFEGDPGLEWFTAFDREMAAPMSSRPVPVTTGGDRAKALEDAARDFCAKVERGEARSRRSYSAFKAALDMPAIGYERPTKGRCQECHGKGFTDEESAQGCEKCGASGEVNAQPVPTPEPGTITGKLITAGTMNVGDDVDVTGVFIQMTEEQLCGVKRLPMYEQVVVTPVPTPERSSAGDEELRRLAGKVRETMFRSDGSCERAIIALSAHLDSTPALPATADLSAVGGNEALVRALKLALVDSEAQEQELRDKWSCDLSDEYLHMAEKKSRQIERARKLIALHAGNAGKGAGT